eukprot:m.61498 g.61498  ORF g.61498 m.61498 type:complete len:274 (-) comp22995_c0_seq2:270-1091(-)
MIESRVSKALQLGLVGLVIFLFMYTSPQLRRDAANNSLNTKVVVTAKQLKKRNVEATGKTSTLEAQVVHNKPDTNSQPMCHWRPETIAGSCVGGTSATKISRQMKTAAECEEACCKLPTEGENRCVLWQFRKSSGCLHGGDSRIGLEKDGIPAWCEPNPPAEWHGQKVQNRDVDLRATACGKDWNPKELQGQCFGLGARRKLKEESAAACRDACCADKLCQTWQWREDVGCYYGGGVGRCDNPADGPFEGRRKFMPNRTYSPPWKAGVEPYRP